MNAVKHLLYSRILGLHVHTNYNAISRKWVSNLLQPRHDIFEPQIQNILFFCEFHGIITYVSVKQALGGRVQERYRDRLMEVLQGVHTIEWEHGLFLVVHSHKCHDIVRQHFAHLFHTVTL
jgi:hypothetical protein